MLKTRLKRFLALLAATAGVIGGGVAPPVSAGSSSQYIRYWAFCGVKWEHAGTTTPSGSYDDPWAAAKVQAMAESGIEATFAPCLTPPANYTPSNPGSRYPTRWQMFSTLWMNAIGPCVQGTNRPAQSGQPCYKMKTVIYDAALWSTNAATRADAVAFWGPHAQYIEAFDLGDEYDCRITSEWNAYKTRAASIWTNYTNNASSPLYKIPGYSTHLPVNGAGGGTTPYNCVQDARWNATGAWYNLGYDNYDVSTSVAWAGWYNAYLGAQSPNLVCAVSVQAGSFNYNPSTITVNSVVNAIGAHRQAGCDTILFFNPGNSVAPAPFAGSKSLSNATAPYARSDWGAAALLAKNYCTGTCPPLGPGGNPPPWSGF